MLIDDGLLRFEDGAWRSVEDLANVTVPPTIHLLLAARLDRLDAEERAVIERGAVEGKVFHSGAVTTLSPDAARPNVRSRLLALARKELIRPDRAEFAGEDAFRFRHLLIRDAAYQAMPKEQRADLHERFADWLADVAGERMAEYEEILGHHLEQAYRYRAELGHDGRAGEGARPACGRHLYASAERADEREDLVAAKALLERSIELSDGPEQLRSLRLAVGGPPRARRLPGGARHATRSIASAPRPSAIVGRRSGPARADHASRASIDPARTIEIARDEATAALDEARRLDDVELRDKAILLLALLTFYQGRTSETVRSSRS